jgi:hypothetical protein
MILIQCKILYMKYFFEIMGMNLNCFIFGYPYCDETSCSCCLISNIPYTVTLLFKN